ncbi:hypothetical protein GF336_07210 [Candidatus Woesearchaeota archaeon]|nr:hypothetical protein [Candidatus Woesearchaeota archaeon]
MYKEIIEGKAKIKVPAEEKISKELPVFYNPVMEFNRTVSVLMLKAVANRNIQAALPLGGTGVRGVRFLKELPKSKIKGLWINDSDKEAMKIIKKNLRMNDTKAEVSNKDANLFLLRGSGFDYIDIDPFGSPNPFLDSAVKRLSRRGILAVTATDTGCLAGSFPKACLRKYWSMPSKDDTMHENGLRILIRKVQLIGAEHGKALTPMYSYFKDHYFRVFFRCEKGKQKVDKLIEKHGMFGDAGPLWLGELWDKKIAAKIAKLSKDKFLKMVAEETKIPVVGFYDVHKICKKNKLSVKKKEEIVADVRKKGYKAAETHFAVQGLRSDIGLDEFVKILKK